MLRKLNLVVRTRVRTHTTKTPNSVTDIFSSVVPNSGSTARDHLANERTFLAWARTGLTFVGLGVAIDSLLRVSAVWKAGRYGVGRYGKWLCIRTIHFHHLQSYMHTHHHVRAPLLLSHAG